MKQQNRSILLANLGFISMSSAGTFAKLIPWASHHIIFARMVTAAVFVLLFRIIQQESLRLPKKSMMVIGFLGVILALHWVTFFASVQVSTVAVGVIASNTSPILTTLLEPLFHKKPYRKIDLLLALIGFIGIVIMIEEFSLGSGTMLGVIFGIIAAFFWSIRFIISKSYVQEHSGSLVMLYQLIVGAIVLSPFLIGSNLQITQSDIWNVLLLGSIATAVGHTFVLSSLKNLTARTANMFGNMLPLYAGIIAFFVVGEIPTLRVFIGGVIVISCVLAETARQQK